MAAILSVSRRNVLRQLGGLLLILAIPLFLLAGGCVAVWVWVAIFPPKPVFMLTVANRGDLAVVGGYFSGDSLWRPVGGIRPGRATQFELVGSSGRPDVDYRLHLARTDSSRVTIVIGWITGEWDLSSLSHDAVIIPDDTTRRVDCRMTMDEQNRLMDTLRTRRLIDEDHGPPPPAPNGRPAV